MTMMMMIRMMKTQNAGIKLLNEGIPVINYEMWGCRYGRTLSESQVTAYIYIYMYGRSSSHAFHLKIEYALVNPYNISKHSLNYMQ